MQTSTGVLSSASLLASNIKLMRPQAIIITDNKQLISRLKLALAEHHISVLTVGTLHQARHLIKHHDVQWCFVSPNQMPTPTVAAKLAKYHPTIQWVALQLGTQAETEADPWVHLVATEPLDTVLLGTLLHRHQTLAMSSVMRDLLAAVHAWLILPAPLYLYGPMGAGKLHFLRHLEVLLPERDICIYDCRQWPSSHYWSVTEGPSALGLSTVNPFLELFRAFDKHCVILSRLDELEILGQIQLVELLKYSDLSLVAQKPHHLFATGRQSLEHLVSQGTLKSELSYLWQSFIMPALKMRRAELPKLCQAILKQLAHPEMTLSQSALTYLDQHDLPGNFYELRHLLDRARRLTPSNIIDLVHLVPEKPIDGLLKSTVELEPKRPLRAHLDELTRYILSQTLNRNRWNKRLTAEHLGLNLRTLRYYLKKYELDSSV